MIWGMRYYDVESDRLPFVNFDVLIRRVKKRVGKIASYRTRTHRGYERIYPTLLEEIAVFSDYRTSRFKINLFGIPYTFE